MADNSVQIREVVKFHGATLAVDRLSLEIRRGEFFSILGPSGAGKTTVLRLLAGFEHPDRGDIRIEGQSMQGVPPNLRPVNLVFQSYALFPHLTVFGNIAFGLEMQRVFKAEIAARVQSALEMVKLTGKERRYPPHLSGGEQQRVALARALVNRPAVVLLDEPLGALDQQLRQEMQVELKTIQEQVGITFIYVTHHQEEALTMSDRLAVMDHGRLLQVGSPQDIYEAPASVFVADFIGVSNRLTGTIDRLDGAACTVTVPDLPPVRVRTPPHLRAGSQVTLLLRAERLELSQDGSRSDRENAAPGRVLKSLYNGGDMEYRVRLTERHTWRVRVPNRGAGQKRFLPGEAVFVRWPADEGVVLPE